MSAKQLKPATEILLSAAFVLTPRKHWALGTYVQVAGGAMPCVGATDTHTLEDAIRWCVVSAIYEAQHALGYPQAIAADVCNALAKQNNEDHAETFNNNSSHHRLLAALYKAAELSEAS